MFNKLKNFFNKSNEKETSNNIVQFSNAEKIIKEKTENYNEKFLKNISEITSFTADKIRDLTTTIMEDEKLYSETKEKAFNLIDENCKLEDTKKQNTTTKKRNKPVKLRIVDEQYIKEQKAEAEKPFADDFYSDLDDAGVYYKEANN